MDITKDNFNELQDFIIQDIQKVKKNFKENKKFLNINKLKKNFENLNLLRLILFH
jgi:hypothetical protein